jgi:hypothetical protein
MTIATAMCIVLCVFIICTFSLFTIVYFSELKREKELRKLMMEEASKSNMVGSMPILVMDLPIKPKSDITPVTEPKPKKNVN